MGAYLEGYAVGLSGVGWRRVLEGVGVTFRGSSSLVSTSNTTSFDHVSLARSRELYV
jgi:hypothetical protein